MKCAQNLVLYSSHLHNNRTVPRSQPRYSKRTQGSGTLLLQSGTKWPQGMYIGTQDAQQCMLGDQRIYQQRLCGNYNSYKQ